MSMDLLQTFAGLLHQTTPIEQAKARFEKRGCLDVKDDEHQDHMHTDGVLCDGKLIGHAYRVFMREDGTGSVWFFKPNADGCVHVCPECCAAVAQGRVDGAIVVRWQDGTESKGRA